MKKKRKLSIFTPHSPPQNCLGPPGIQCQRKFDYFSENLPEIGGFRERRIRGRREEGEGPHMDVFEEDGPPPPYAPATGGGGGEGCCVKPQTRASPHLCCIIRPTRHIIGTKKLYRKFTCILHVQYRVSQQQFYRAPQFLLQD